MKLKVNTIIIIGLLLINGCASLPPPKPSHEDTYKPEPRPTYVSVEEQKEIYYALVKLQDSETYAHHETFSIIASRYNISIQNVKNIAVKGIKGDWERP